MRLVIVSGRSGSGKTSALHLLEDEGFTCIDNLPVSLLPPLCEQVFSRPDADQTNFAIGIDARNIASDLSAISTLIKLHLPKDVDRKVLYLDSAHDILLKRFSETRRKHPLSNKQVDLNQAIRLEKQKLEPIARCADITIDTSQLSLHELRSNVKHLIVGKESSTMAIVIKSFGFKYGVPVDTDFIYDVRCLPNPYWSPNLRTQSGLEAGVIDFLSKQDDVNAMFNDIYQFIDRWAPSFQANNRSYLTVAIGCTGGKHRSVYLTERLMQALKQKYANVQSRHRQIHHVNGQ